MSDWTGGRLTREYIVRCACGSETILGPLRSKDAAAELAEGLRWKQEASGEWKCPGCQPARCPPAIDYDSLPPYLQSAIDKALARKPG